MEWHEILKPAVVAGGIITGMLLVDSWNKRAAERRKRKRDAEG